MSCEEIAVALWKQDYEDLLPKYRELLSSADVRNESTPDEDYVVLYWPFGVPFTRNEVSMYQFRIDIADIRHTFVSISEEGKIESEAVSDDSRGCDEVFDEILGWRADICVWGESISSKAEVDSGSRWPMTVEEAIRQLEYDRDMCRFNPLTGENTPMSEENAKSADALDMAIEALRKGGLNA